MLTQIMHVNFSSMTAPHLISVVQGDTGRNLKCIVDDFTLDGAWTATWYVERPSDVPVYNTATIETSDNSVNLELTAQSINEVGDNKLQVRILDADDQVVTSFACILSVKPFGGIGAVESTTESNIFDQQVAEAKQEIDTHKADALEEIDTEIDTHVANGKFPNMAAGDIISDLYAENKTPYFFRPSGGGAEVGTIEAPVLVGGSVGWNQLANLAQVRTDSQVASDKGINYAKNADGSFTLSGTANATGNADFYFTLNEYASVVSGHRYITGNETRLYTNVSETGKVYTATATGFARGWIRIAVTQGTTYNIKVYPQVFDLTLLLGSTIADRIYTLEQSTAGSGIAQLRAWGFDFSEYIPYSAPTLKHVEGVSAHKFVGFNQWDEEVANGYYNNVGVFFQNSSYVATKNKIPVLPSTEYNFHSGSKNGGRVCFYDKEETFVSTQTGFGSIADWLFTTPANAFFMTFDMTSAYGNTYHNDICINLSNTAKNGQYEPYRTWSYALDSTLTLRGVPKLDANNQLYYDGDTYAPDGTVTRRYGVVDLGGLDWARLTTNVSGKYRFESSGIATEVQKPSSLSEVANIICAKYVAISGDKPITNVEGIAIHTNGNILIYDESQSAVEASAFKTAMSGVYLVYEASTEETETATPYTEYQEVDANGTEEYVSTGVVPVGHTTKYPTDLKGTFEAILSAIPSANGTYALKVTVNNGKHTFSWV